MCYGFIGASCVRIGLVRCPVVCAGIGCGFGLLGLLRVVEVAGVIIAYSRGVF